MQTFRIEKLENLPQKISVIIWDINGTITLKDQLDEEVGKVIVETAVQGLQHIFITGRDRAWIINFFVTSLRRISTKEGIDFDQVLSNIWLYPELGLIYLISPSLTPTLYEGIENHPLIISPLRQRLATFFWQVHQLQEWKEGEDVPPRHYIIRDANGKGFLCPLIPQEIEISVKLPDFIWSDTKEIIGTAEIIREQDNQILRRRQTKIDLATRIIESFLDYWEIRDVSVSPVSTAINFAPVVDDQALDKDWAAGRAIVNLAQGKNVDLSKILKETIAIGDGKADFLFSRPIFKGDKRENIPFIFVGHGKPKVPKEQEDNTVIWATTQSGPIVTKEVLDYLKGRFQPL